MPGGDNYSVVARGPPFDVILPLLIVQRANLKIHLREHTDEEEYRCQKCIKNLLIYCHFRSYMMIYRGEKPYECN